MNWNYNPYLPLPARDLDKLTAFLDHLFGTLGSFGATFDYSASTTEQGDVYESRFYLHMQPYSLNILPSGIVEVINSDGKILGTLELENVPES